MRLLNRYLDPGDAAEARESLRRAGIASLVETMGPDSDQPAKSGATHVGLWVLADDQFEDAVQVLENSAHVPSRVLDVAEMNRLEQRAGQRVHKVRLMDNVLLLLLVSILMGLVVFTAVDFFLGW